MKYIWVVDVDEEKAKQHEITPGDVTKAIESLGKGCFEVLEIIFQEDDAE